jgi:hypothetical protein
MDAFDSATSFSHAQFLHQLTVLFKSAPESDKCKVLRHMNAANSAFLDSKERVDMPLPRTRQPIVTIEEEEVTSTAQEAPQASQAREVTGTAQASLTTFDEWISKCHGFCMVLLKGRRKLYRNEDDTLRFRTQFDVLKHLRQKRVVIPKEFDKRRH